jgi:sporulation protein YlmC with PRC-barrel domain
VRVGGILLAHHRGEKEDVIMRKTASVLTVSILSLALAVTASAQTTRPAGETGSKAQRQAWAWPSTAVEGKQIVGMKVKNDQGKDVGEIDQLIVDPGAGKITHVVLGRGGVLGVGEQKVVLAWSDLKIQPDATNRHRRVAMVDQSKLDSAPRYEARRDTTPAASPTTTPSSQPTPARKY